MGIRRLAKRSLAPLLRWRPAALFAQRYFWQRYFRTGGGRWAEEYKARLDAQAPVVPFLRQYVEAVEADPVDVLDVGAGPVTSIGYRSQSKNVRITAVDEAAPAYRRILSRAGVVPPVWTQYARGETLGRQFAPETFDITHCRNALDHMSDPLRAIEEMFAVTKRGGYLVLQHAVNEGETQEYAGLHQWNLTMENGDVVIWRPNRKVNLTKVFEDRCSIDAHVNAGWSFVAMRRRK